MWNVDLLMVGKRLMRMYETYCIPVCRRYEINQSMLDILMFLAVHPDQNTAKDICGIRGMKKGIVSVTLEHLEQDGYLERREDPEDRRIQRLYVTARSAKIIRDGKAQQKLFLTRTLSCLSQEERFALKTLTAKLKEQIRTMEKEMEKMQTEKEQRAGTGGQRR